MQPATTFHSHDFEWADLAATCQEALAKEAKPVESVDAAQLSALAQTHWDVFHAKNNGKVYKPRNYLSKEFPELLSATSVLEVGCGYGSAIFPLLAQCPTMRAHVCDFSRHAIDILRGNQAYETERCHAFVCDIVADEIDVPDASIDVVLMVFVLSAIPPSAFASVLAKVHRALKPGGLVCFRDYGRYDLAMMRSSKRLSDSDALYYRSDGTLAYFFSTDDITAMAAHRFEVVENEYNTVRLRNRKTQASMDRVWVHAKLRKPTA
ncbi:methyltransferase domain-containing protein [Achlya hypogyna]|uniref:tRNA N(3)-methylcytidine methyltransferase n=1 Tax=Achlya hypogyna TaxID=1202772 RepID=A0A1V9YNU6_ACHHY|nr:methyltransferase domain-containing protein [Achlya hypogyna]